MVQVIFISSNNVRDAWLSALVQVLFKGDNIKTEYDNDGEIPSKDASVLIEIKKPFNNPIMRKDKVIKIKSKYGNAYEVYGCMADTYLIGSIQSGYIDEILEGVNDHYIWDSGASFPYSYHDRIFNYTPFSLEDTIHVNYDLDIVDGEFVKNHQKLIHSEKIIKAQEGLIWNLKDNFDFNLEKQISQQIGIDTIPIGVLTFPKVNQIEYIIQKLKQKPFSRRAQAITWRPLVDPFHSDPPCLQRIYMRIKDDQLIMQTTWRSRDLFRAWEANVNGMIRIQKYVADQLNVSVGHYLDFSNSLHIYGNTIDEVKDMLTRMKNKNEIFPEEIKDLIETKVQ
ncbi:MAG: thymidylate synthase [Candidatus Lokiarchaeota archaeon]